MSELTFEDGRPTTLSVSKGTKKRFAKFKTYGLTDEAVLLQLIKFCENKKFSIKEE